MQSSFTLVRVRGIPIGVHWNWLLVFAIVVWSLATALFPATYPGLDGTTYLVMAVVAGAIFFGSILLHELGHAIRAQREGLKIEGITLWLLGGVSHLGELPQTPGAEFRVAIWGPSVSAALALAFGALAFVGDQTGFPSAIQGVVDYLARVNGLVFVFNLIPALPLDGGRVLRAWLWRRTGSFVAATRSAARAGSAFGFVLVAIGLVELFTPTGGAGLGGLWLVFLGWFLIQAAQGEGQLADAALLSRLGQVREVLLPQPAVVGGPVRVLVTEDGRLLEVPPHLPPPFEDGSITPGDQRPRRVGLGVWLLVGLVFFVAAAAMYHPPYVVIAPGTTFDVSGDVSISGVPTTPVNGTYLATSVQLSQPSALRLLVAAVRPDREVLALRDVLPEGVDARRFDRTQREIFKESQLLAAVAAARSLGMPVTVTSSGARVVDVVRGSPATNVLQPGDVILAIDGQPVTQAGTVGEVVRSKPAGSEFRFSIDRDARRMDAIVRSRDLPQLSGGVGIGISVQSHGLRADLPFSFQVRDREAVGGPSAGFIYALAIADVLSAQDHAGGRTVAATGTIDPDGDVGPVGGVKEKAIAVQRAGADVFMVPASEVDQARRPGLRVAGVERLQQAMDSLSAA